jgi:hypothetical protein
MYFCFDQIKTKMCDKASYESFFAAQKVINAFAKKGRSYSANRRRLSNKKPKRAYRCPYCGEIHLTSLAKKRD